MSKLKTRVRQQASQLLDTLIPEGKWDQYVDALDREGKFSRKVMLSLLMMLCQQIESMEDVVEDIYFRIEMLEGKTTVKPEPVKVRLRFIQDILKDYDNDPQAEVYYATPGDWDILITSLDPQLAKTDPEYGYGKEIDPKDKTEKTCLYRNGKPIFRQSN